MIGGSNINLTAVIKAKDEASQVFNNVGKSNQKLIGGLKNLGIAGAAAVAGIGIASVKMAADFEKSMANVSTLVDTSKESMKDMSDEVLEIAKRVPVEISDLTTALYDVRSAGISAEDAMMVLEKSAMLAKAGLGTTQEAVNLATSAINSFGLEGEEAAKVFDTIQLTVKAGKTNIAELAQSFGMVSGVASTAGVSVNELMAATAALTTSGLKASVAQTQLRSAILSIQAPTKDMNELISGLGYESGATMIEQLGLVESMRQISKEAGGNVEILKKAYGSVEALGSSLALTGAQGDAFVDTLAAMENGSGTLDKEFAKVKETFDASWKLLKNNFNVEMIKLGEEILPRIIERLPDIIKVMEATFNGLEKLLDGALWLMDAAEKVAEFLGGGEYNKASSAYRKEVVDGKTQLVLKDVYRDDFVSDGSVGDYMRQNKIAPTNQATNYSFVFNGDVNDEQKLSNLIKQSINRDSSLKLYGGQ